MAKAAEAMMAAPVRPVDSHALGVRRMTRML
jgi:hypothetical protein